jgi:hypothetical protein
VPALQVVQAVAPSALEKVPGAHWVQVVSAEALQAAL